MRPAHLSRLVVLMLVLTACGARRPATAAPMVPGRLPGEEIAGIALLANNVEVAYAFLAVDRATDADVQSYATRMRTDHRSLDGTLTDLLAALDLDARDDSLGVALREASVARRAALARLHGRAFDATYLDTDIASHRELLALVDGVLLPSASRRDLRAYLAGLRPALAAHLAHAEQLRATLAARQR